MTITILILGILFGAIVQYANLNEFNVISGLAMRKDFSVAKAIALAVGIGIICALHISQKLFGLDKSVLEQSQKFILGNAGFFDINDIRENILFNMQQDKKNESGNVNFTLLKELGVPVIKQKVELKLLENSLDYYSEIIQ